MLTNMNAAAPSVAVGDLSRRSLLGFALFAAFPLTAPAHAEPGSGDATATITQFNGALLGTMKAGAQTDFNRRFQAVAPAVERAFDLPAVLSVSVGLGWAGFSPDHQARLLEAFRRYTVASYVASFDSFNGQTFIVSPGTRSLDGDRVVVHSRIVPLSGEATELDYVMKPTASGWKIVDVLVAGSISRVAVQRSDFRHLLSRGGGDALLASLQRKASDLSGGVLA